MTRATNKTRNETRLLQGKNISLIGKKTITWTRKKIRTCKRNQIIELLNNGMVKFYI